MNPADNYPWVDFEQGYNALCRLMATIPTGTPKEEISDRQVMLFQAKYGVGELAAYRGERVIWAAQSIVKARVNLILAKLLSIWPDKKSERLDHRVLRAAYMLIVEQGIQQPTPQQLVECAQKLEPEKDIHFGKPSGLN